MRALLCGCVISAAMTAHAAAAERPNMLFLFTDDQRADTIAALGNARVITPNLDALVRRGFTFRNAYCMGSNRGAVCFPSRNMLLSGRYYFRIENNGLASRRKPNFPQTMKDAGYVTYHHGKRGNTAHDIHKAFDVSKYVQDMAARTSGEPGKQIVDEAIAFLREDRRGRGRGRGRGKPFFMYLAFATPHDPRVAAEKYRRMYDRDAIPLPKNYMPLHPFDNGEMTVRDERLAPWPRTETVVREHLHDYYATITGLDQHIGRLLDHLDKTGQLENTLVVFSSDHGLAIGSHGLFGKQSLYEHSMKSPLVIAGPGIPQGESDALAYLLDIYPTVCDLVGADVPEGIDGQSLVPVIKGEQKTIRDSIFTAYGDVQRAVRTDRWKLIRYPHINKTQLFDLQSDPHELNDLASDPGRRETVEELMGLIRRWQKQAGDTANLSTTNPQNPEWSPPATGAAAAKG